MSRGQHHRHHGCGVHSGDADLAPAERRRGERRRAQLHKHHGLLSVGAGVRGRGSAQGGCTWRVAAREVGRADLCTTESVIKQVKDGQLETTSRIVW